VAVAVTVFTLCVTAAPSWSALTTDELSLLGAMNQVRAEHGLRPLRSDGRLERAARAHSARMLRINRIFHGAFSVRIRGVGVRDPRVGENLAWSTGSLARARAIVRAWLASPRHRANLLRPGYRIVGVGALRGNFAGYRGAVMITTDFAGR
jgi:uncharacterized protein YkwD